MILLGMLLGLFFLLFLCDWKRASWLWQFYKDFWKDKI